jgi:hypothetical protein
MAERMPIPSERRAYELAAAFIEADLHKMRADTIRLHADHGWDHPPLGTSHEADLMKAVEWATAAAILRQKAAAGN